MRALNLEDSVLKVSRAAGIETTEAGVEPPQTLVAEYLRYSIVDLCSRNKGPVYVTRLLNQVRRQLLALWFELDESDARCRGREYEETKLEDDSLRTTLNALSEVRDTEELDGGYWLPTPIRLVRLPGSDRTLLIGGQPTPVLARGFGVKIARESLARHASTSSLSNAEAVNQDTWQRYSDWLGETPDDLSNWTNNAFRRASERLAASAADLVDFEAYVPMHRRARLQFHRWVHASRLPAANTGLQLCRAKLGPKGGRRHWIGKIEHSYGRLVCSREAPIAPLQRRRLMYGLDIQAECATSAQIESLSDNVTLELSNPLPPEERRLLLALASEVSEVLGRFPLRYRMSTKLYPTLAEKLDALGVVLEVRQT